MWLYCLMSDSLQWGKTVKITWLSQFIIGCNEEASPRSHHASFRSCRPFSFTSRPASTVSFKITISSWLFVLLPFTWESDCSNGEQRHTNLLLACSKDHLLWQTKPFYALNLTQTSMHWLPATAVSLLTRPWTQPALWSHGVLVSSQKSMLHAWGDHTPTCNPFSGYRTREGFSENLWFSPRC